MEKTIISKLHEVMEENHEYCDRDDYLKGYYSLGCAVGLSFALGTMGLDVTIDGANLPNFDPRIRKVEINKGTRTGTAASVPPQVAELPKDLFLCRPLVELGEALKESCPPNDCVIYRNVYEMYCEKLADYKRIVAACPDLADSTTRALTHAIRADEIQLYDMWKTNTAVNRKREAMRYEKEQKARIAAKARE